MACEAKRMIVPRHFNFLLVLRNKINMPFTLDFKLNGQVKILRLARKVGCKTSKLMEENTLNGVCVEGRVDPKDGKYRKLKRNIKKAEKRKVSIKRNKLSCYGIYKRYN